MGRKGCPAWLVSQGRRRSCALARITASVQEGGKSLGEAILAVLKPSGPNTKADRPATSRAGKVRTSGLSLSSSDTTQSRTPGRPSHRNQMDVGGKGRQARLQGVAVCLWRVFTPLLMGSAPWGEVLGERLGYAQIRCNETTALRLRYSCGSFHLNLFLFGTLSR